MSYERHFECAIARLKAEKRYRVFADLERDAARFPVALWRPEGESDAPREVTVWCSNDYLGMGGIQRSWTRRMRALERHGAGAGGTRNISGTHHPIVELEAKSPICTASTRPWPSPQAGFPIWRESPPSRRCCPIALSCQTRSTITQ